MLELNRAERKALALAAALLTLGAIVREAWAPGAAAWSWESTDAGELSSVRSSVAEGVATEEEASRPLERGERIDPNLASEAQLRRLPGIGPSRARAIIAAREEARFRAAGDLLRVPGVGETILARIAPHLSLRMDDGSGDEPTSTGGCTGLDLNGADASALETLPFVGPARAREVLETRRRLGGFRSVDQLVEVAGIGPYILERLRPHVCVR